MSSDAPTSWTDAAVAALSRASRSIGVLDGALHHAPPALSRELARVASERPGRGIDPRRQETLQQALGVHGGADLVAVASDMPGGPVRADRLVAIAASAERAADTVLRVRSTLDEHGVLVSRSALGRYGPAILDLLVERPVLTIKEAVEHLDASPTTVGGLFDRLVELGIVVETTGKRRGRVYRYAALLDPFAEVVATEATTAGQNGRMGENPSLMSTWVPIVVQRVFDGSDAQRVVVFGSVARGEDGPDSDIDILVVLPHVTRSHDDAVRIMRLLRDVPCGVDVLVTDADRLEQQSRVPGIIRVALREGHTFERAA